MINLKWFKCGDDQHWCSLKDLNLTGVTERGVYIIWFAGNPGKVVRVGQGDVADRLLKHRADRQITTFANRGKLLVTWASVPAHQMDGVERYLADKWNPLVGDAFPDVRPIAVNSPFAA